MNIIKFLEARIAEDEATARAAIGAGPKWESMTEETPDGENIYYTIEEVGTYDSPLLDLSLSNQTGRAQADHIARWDPARVLAECAAKRAIIKQAVEASNDRAQVIDDYHYFQATKDEAYATDPGLLIIRALAAVYSDHRNYQQEWA